ncbi:MAG: hypothetical protein D6718_11935 [Acidobacteria bacterium]|nr:MAG: hypothetical protein D6718_11935 [Acidobacteriota bacterium]
MRACLSIVIALCAVPAAMAGPAAGDPDGLRQELERQKTREDWDRTARRLLASLDASGQGGTAEAAWLVAKLLETHPDDPLLLWRRGEIRRRGGDVEGAIADFEQLARRHPGHPAGIRARRALPALYLRAGLTAKAARADESLLEDGLADPIPVLSRLARTYARLGRPAEVKRTLARLAALAPGRASYDPGLAWLAAEASAALDDPLVAAAGMLRFANLFPADPHRYEALMRAAEAFARHGRHALAATLAEEVAESSADAELAARAWLLRGEAFERAGDLEKARDAYRRGLDGATNPRLAATALRHLIDLTIREHGSETALLMLASDLRRGDRFRRKLAEAHFPRLLEAMASKLSRDPAKAYFFERLLEELDLTEQTPPAIALGAAELLESIGEEEAAGRLYSRLAAGGGPAAGRARAGLARCAPPKAPGVGPAEAIAALARKGRWDEVLVRSAELGPQPPARAAALAARAAMRAGRLAEARPLLEAAVEPPEGAPPALLVERADLLALGGRWDEACALYRKAAGRPEHLLPAERSWLDLRGAACAFREGRAGEAARRVRTLLARSPGEPIRFAAENLLERIEEAAPGESRS